MVAETRVNVHETMGRKNNCELNFFSVYFVRNNKEIHFSFKNSEKWRTQALKTTILLLEIIVNQLTGFLEVETLTLNKLWKKIFTVLNPLG